MVLAEGLDKGLSPEDVAQVVVEDYIVPDLEDDDMENMEAAFDPKLAIEVSLEEDDEWCKPWKYFLIVKLLGKKISLKIMGAWIQRRWAKASIAFGSK